MEKKRTRLTALLLAVCMALSLAACGKKDGDTKQLSGTVYVPEFVECRTPEGFEYVNSGCTDGEYLYFTADVQGEEHMETWTDPETGETEEYSYYDYRTTLFRLSLEGGDVEELENYVPLTDPQDTDSGSYINAIEPAGDGGVWLTEDMTVYLYDLPDDYVETEDNRGDKWQYQTDYEETMVRRRLDSTGRELERMDVSGAVLEEKLGVDYIGSTFFDKDGNVYVSLEETIAVLDKELNKLFELDTKNLWGYVMQLADGRTAMFASYNDPETDEYHRKMMFIDLENQCWGEEFMLNTNIYNLIPGSGDYLFYYQNSDSIYGWKSGATEGEKLFSWLGAGLDRSDIPFFSFLADGRVAAMTRKWKNGTSKEERTTMEVGLALLTPTDASTLPEKTTLTLATMWLNYNMRGKILKFNESSPTCRIEVVDYSEYATDTDERAGLTKLNTEIVAGNVPDIICTGELPISRYAGRGILEDLWPYIEADTEIGGRAGLMEHVLDAASVDGKLYQAFDGFSIITLIGPAAVVGDRMTWTLAELQEALKQMPEDCTIFNEDTTKDWVLNQVLSLNMSQFVDWDAGTCSFDSDAFKAQLAFCNSFPAEFDWSKYDEMMSDMAYEGDLARMLNGRQLLTRTYFSDFTRPQLYDSMFPNGGFSFIGYPMEDGSVGSRFSLNSGLAMSSTCKDKDAAWSFIRQLFLSQATEDNYNEYSGRYYFNSFPINKGDFEMMKEDALTEMYDTDENGNRVLDENGQPVKLLMDSWYISDNVSVEIYSATQNDVDRIMTLYESIDAVDGYDESLYSIIEEAVGAYFAGDKDLDATASDIQNRAQLYIGENK